MIRRALVCTMALCFAAATLFAQAAAVGDMMTITPHGLFVLKNSVLTKFDPATLKQQGPVLELFGAMPEQPAMSNPPTDQEKQARMAWSNANNARNAAATMLAKDKELLIVMNYTLFRVNQQTMVLETTQPNLLADDPQNPKQAWLKPVLLLNDNTLYILLNNNMVAVNADTADVLCSGVLPKEATQRPQMMGGPGNGHHDPRMPPHNNTPPPTIGPPPVNTTPPAQ